MGREKLIHWRSEKLSYNKIMLKSTSNETLNMLKAVPTPKAHVVP